MSKLAHRNFSFGLFLGWSLLTAAIPSPLDAKDPVPKPSAAETVGKVLDGPAGDDAADDMLDVDEREPFAPPIMWYANAPKTDVVRVMSAMRKILDDDWNSSDLKVPLLQPRVDEALRKCATDPRINYGWGLYLAQHNQPDKALAQFDEAVKKSPQFLAALQAVAWYRLDRSEFATGGKHLEGVVTLIATDDDYPTQSQREDASRWLGRVIGYLEGPVTKAPTELVARLKTRINEKLPAEHQTLVESGRISALEYWEELQGIAALSTTDLRGRLQRIRREVEANQQTLAAEVAPVRKQIQDGAAETNEMQKQLTLAANSIKAARTQVVQLVQNAARLTRTSYGDVVKEKVPEYEYETKTKRDSEGNRYEVKEKVFKGYKTVERQLPETAEQNQRRRNDIQNALNQADGLKSQIGSQQDLLKQQQTVFRELQKTSRQAYRTQHAQLAALLEDEAELKRRAKQLDGWIAQPAQFAAHIHRIEPYVPWDANTQRTALLSSFDPRRPTTGGQ